MEKGLKLEIHLVKKQINSYTYIAKAYLISDNDNEILNELLNSNCPKKAYSFLRGLGYSIRTVGSDKKTQVSLVTYCPYHFKHTCNYHKRRAYYFSDFRNTEEFNRIIRKMNTEKIKKTYVDVVAE
jgi:hypothetical protein